MDETREKSNSENFKYILPIKNKFLTNEVKLTGNSGVYRKLSAKLKRRNHNIDLEKVMPNFIQHYEGKILI